MFKLSIILTYIGGIYSQCCNTMVHDPSVYGEMYEKFGTKNGRDTYRYYMGTPIWIAPSYGDDSPVWYYIEYSNTNSRWEIYADECSLAGGPGCSGTGSGRDAGNGGGTADGTSVQNIYLIGWSLSNGACPGGLAYDFDESGGYLAYGADPSGHVVNIICTDSPSPPAISLPSPPSLPPSPPSGCYSETCHNVPCINTFHLPKQMLQYVDCNNCITAGCYTGEIQTPPVCDLGLTFSMALGKCVLDCV